MLDLSSHKDSEDFSIEDISQVSEIEGKEDCNVVIKKSEDNEEDQNNKVFASKSSNYYCKWPTDRA